MNIEYCVIFLTQPVMALLRESSDPIMLVAYGLATLCELLGEYAEPLASGGDEL